MAKGVRSTGQWVETSVLDSVLILERQVGQLRRKLRDEVESNPRPTGRRQAINDPEVWFTLGRIQEAVEKMGELLAQVDSAA